MNLLIIPSWYPSKGLPINGSFFREQAIALVKGGHDVSVIDITFHGRNDILNSANFKFRYTNDNGIHTYSFKIPSLYILSRVHFLYLWIYKALLLMVFKKIIKRGSKFDIIHAHSFYLAGYCAVSISKKYNIPLVVTEHSSGILSNRLKSTDLRLLKHTIFNCDKFICVSESLRQSIEEQTKFSNKLLVVPNMVSSDFTYIDLKGKKEPDFLFVSIGFLNIRKRHEFAISCFKEAFKGISNVKLEIIGNGHLYDALQKQIIDEGLQERVLLLGQLDRTLTAKKLKECNAFILASSFETFGVVYVEALACGKPVIATKNGGANNIVNAANGLLIEKDNKEQLIEAFKYMYRNASKFNSKKIAADCYEKYSEEAVTTMLSKLYTNVVEIQPDKI